MRRREFMARSGVAAGALALPKFSHAAGKKHSKQLLELRIYHFASSQKQQTFAQFLGNAAVPAFNRAGSRPVGLFRLLMNDNPELKLASDSTDVYVLLPHSSAESFGSFHDRLALDKVFQQAAQPIISAPVAEPAYLRYESTLMRPFDGFPEVRVPTQSAGRLLQLRIYESHNQERALKKIEMLTPANSRSSFVAE